MNRMVITGFAIWAGATIALRLAGPYILRSPIILLAVSIPLMIGVALAVLRRSRTPATDAIYLAAPGMLLDAISAAWFSTIFPNVPADKAGLFGGWLLLCNVVVLLTAVGLGRGAAIVEHPLQLAADQRRGDQPA